MTWVIGTPTAFGFACGISDIRVTWSNGRTLDCVQKIYPVGADLAAGFAGSVRFGFELIDDLRSGLRLDDPGRTWKPRALVLPWYRRARWLFGRAPDDVKRLGAQVMLLGVSPTENIGLPRFHLATVAIMRSPDFVPDLLATAAVDSIGSGGSVAVYIDMMRRVSAEPFLWEMELKFPGAYPKMVRHVLQQTIEKNPPLTVSPHVHVCTVQPGAIEITTSNHNRLSSSGELTEWRMPPVATTWPEFEAMTERAGADAATAMS